MNTTYTRHYDNHWQNIITKMERLILQPVEDDCDIEIGT